MKLPSWLQWIIDQIKRLFPPDPVTPGTQPPDAPPGPGPVVPPSPPGPGGNEPPAPGGAAGDQIDPKAVTWLHGRGEVAGWPVTSHLEEVEMDGRGAIIFPYDATAAWPAFSKEKNVSANPWVFAKVGGQWYGATWEWLRPGVTLKRLNEPGDIWPASLFKRTKIHPLAGHIPLPGDEVGFMISTLARGGERTINRRTQIVKVRWPG